MKFRFIVFAAALLLTTGLSAQKYPGGLVDKTVAVVGNEVILVSDIESTVQQEQAQGRSSDRDMRCTILERMMENKIFLMQARIDSLTVNYDMVDGELTNRIDQYRTFLGGDEELEKYFGKPLYKLRQEWRQMFEEQSLIQSEQGEIAGRIPEVTPYDVQQFLDTVSVEDLPVVPIKYQLSQICIYPDREAAAMAVKERLLSLRERVINGERFATLARIYSEDPGSVLRGSGQRPPRRRAGHGVQVHLLAGFLRRRDGPAPGRHLPDRGDPGRLPHHRGHREEGRHVQRPSHPPQASIHRGRP